MLPPALPPILTPNPFADIEAATGALLTRTSGPLLQMGLRLLVSCAGLTVAWHGIKAMLEGQGPNLSALTRLMMTLAFAYTLLRFYAVPLPGLSVSFPGLIVEQANYVAALIEATGVQHVFETLDRVYQQMQRPTAWALLEGAIYLTLVVVLAVAKFVALAVTAFGLIATAVCILLGPLFIPFLVVPGFEWMFWGWFRSLLQFAFYRVVAQAMISLFGSFVISFCQQFPDGLNVGQQVLYFLHFVMLLGAFALGLLQVPALTSAIFTGHPGGLTTPTNQFFAVRGRVGRG